MKDSNKKITEDPPKKIDWEMVEKDLIEKQDLWWLNESKVVGKKKTQLEVALETGRSFKKEELFASKNWLSPENYQTYIRRVFEILQKHKNEHGFLDRETDEAFEVVKEEHALMKKTLTSMNGRRKPHTVFAAFKKKSGVKRGDAWAELKNYAKKSKGDVQIDLPGFGLVYLKMDKDTKKGNLRYKETVFHNPNEGLVITRKAFDSAWDD